MNNRALSAHDVYIVLGIDDNEHDQVVACFRYFDDAQIFCRRVLMTSDFLDVWIEKHPIHIKENQAKISQP